MKWYSGLRIKEKIIFSFSLVAFFAIVLVIVIHLPLPPLANTVSSALLLVSILLSSYLCIKHVASSLNQLVNISKAAKDARIGSALEVNLKNEIGDVARNLDGFFYTLSSINRELLEVNKTIDLHTTKGYTSKKLDAVKYNGDWRNLVESINSILDDKDRNTLSIKKFIDSFSVGVFDKKILEDKNINKDLLDSLNKLNTCLNCFSTDTLEALNSILDGNFSKPISYEKYNGKLKEIALTIYSLSGSLNTFTDKTCDSLNNINSCIFTSDITAKHKGRFAVLTNSINSVNNTFSKFYDETLSIFNAISTGDFSATYSNNFPEISDKWTSASKYLKELLDRLSDVSHGLKQKVDDVTSVSSRLNFISGNQSDLIKALSLNLDNINKQIYKDAAFIKEARNITQDALEKFQGVTREIQAMYNVMSEIDSSSGNIMNIIKSIDDISFQTQLLSLNASIEAARVGQYGRSFGVVAGKVGELAGKSKEAADETETLLDDMLKKFHTGMEMSSNITSIVGSFMSEISAITNLINDTSNGIEHQMEIVGHIDRDTHELNANLLESTNLSGEVMAIASEIFGHADFISKGNKGKNSEVIAKMPPEKTVSKPFERNNDLKAPKPTPTVTQKTQTPPKPAPTVTQKTQTPPKPTPTVTQKPQTPPKPTPTITQKPQTPPKPTPTITQKPQTPPKPTPTITQKPQTQPKPVPIPTEQAVQKNTLEKSNSGVASKGVTNSTTKPKPKAAIVSIVKTDGFDGSKEYDKKDFGKY